MVKRIYNLEITRFGIVGGTGYIINFAILFLITDIVGLYYLLSAGISLLVNSIWNYELNSRMTFKMKSGVKGYFKYLMATMLTRGIYFLLLFALTDLIGIYYLISSAMAVGICFVINYVLSKKYVWKKVVIKESSL